MQQIAVGAAPPSAEDEMIEGLRGRIEAWRQSPTRGRAMPEELWEEACAAAQLLGAFRVSRALSLNHDTLKRRAGLGEPEGAERPTFIELPGLAPFAAGDEAVVEVVAADGTKLTVRMKGSSLNLGALIQEFRGRA